MNYDPAPQRSYNVWIMVGVGLIVLVCLGVVVVGGLGALGYAAFAINSTSVVQATSALQATATGIVAPTAATIVAAPPDGANGKGYGPTDAKVVVQEFGDFQCPPCKRFHETIQPRLLQDYLATGKFRFEFHHYIVIDLNTGGSESRHAAEATECANAQGLFWNYVEVLFAHQNGEGQGAFNDPKLSSFAEQAGLNVSQFNQCFTARTFANAVRQDETIARTDGLNSTPSVLVNGVKVDNWSDYATVAAAVDAAMAK